MKVALIHDYLSEFGGAERVLRVLADMYPNAPIYTAFRVKGSQSDKEFTGRDIRESFLAPLLRIGNLYSPLRFLAPFVWRSFNLSGFDMVIASSSWFITRGFKVGKNTKVICYCHTPPRYLYGYETSVNLVKYWPVRTYAAVVNHFLRMYDFYSAQRVDQFIANSENVKARIRKFYRKEAVVVYPPVEVRKIAAAAAEHRKENIRHRKEYFLIVSRLVGGKGLEAAAEAANRVDFRLLVVGEAAGYSRVKSRIQKLSASAKLRQDKGGNNVELIGRVDDKALYKLYAEAKGFIALARDEDFGMTVVEAQAAGTPVIAYNGGGFLETVIDGVTGIFVKDTDTRVLQIAMAKFKSINWDKKRIQGNALRFSREEFEKRIRKAVDKALKYNGS